MLIAFFSIIALLFGSFTNVLIYRIPKNLSIFNPGSFCPECKRPIPWSEKLPLLSYLFLGAKCKECKTKIPISYPLVELVVPALSYKFILEAAWNTKSIQEFKLSFQESILMQFLNFLDFLFPVILISITVALAVIDHKQNILPHKLTYSGILIALVFISIFGTRYYDSSEIFSFVLNGYLEAFFSSLMQLGIIFFSLDALTHFVNRIYYRKDALEIASSGLSFGIKAIERKISLVYLLIIILVLTLMMNFQDFYLHYLFVLIGFSYLFNEIIRDYFFSSIVEPIQGLVQSNKKTVLGGGDVAMIAMIGVVFGISKTLLIVLVAFYLLFVYLMFKFIKVFFENAFNKRSETQVNGLQLLKDNLARHIPFGGALAISFIAAMMIFS